MNGPVVYISASFPKLSETFVYREVLGLRAAGFDVPVVSVNASSDAMGEPALEALKAEVIPLYGAGGGALVRDALGELAAHPGRALCTLVDGLWLALAADDLRGLTARAKTLFQAFASLALARRLRPLRPCLLHAHMAHVPATMALFAARQLGIPFSFTGHAADLFRDRALLAVKLRRAAFVNCISHWHRQFYRQLVPRPDADYPVVRCGVDPAEFPPRVPRTDGCVRLLAAGRLVRKKGFDVLLEALADPALCAVPWQLRLIGDGPEHDALLAQAAAHPCAERICLAGAMANEAVRREMIEADVFALPCRIAGDGDRDGIPVVLMEAMAAGATVISGDLPAIRELVEDGRSGLMVAPGNAGALAAALASLCTDSARRQALADGGRLAVSREFALGVNIERMVENMNRQVMSNVSKKL